MGGTSPRLVDVTLADLRRALITAALLLTVLYLFLAMVGSVLLAGVLGVVVGIYLHPLALRLERILGSRAVGALLSLSLLLLPTVAVGVYGYTEVEDAAEYLQGHSGEVAGRIEAALSRVPVVGGASRTAIQDVVESAAEWGATLPARVDGLLAGFLVGLGIFLFTAFYVITDAERIVEYLRESIPLRYSALVEALEANARGVLYGTIFAVLLTQALKATVLLALFLIFGVPLPVTLAVIAFFVGFFPIVGSWTIYLPAAGYLLVFEEAPVQALVLVVTAFVLSTVVLSLYIRPKLAAERSGVLNFYWMFLGLVAGVFAFGLPGVIVGPLLIGLLKAILDTLRASESWQAPPDEDEEPEAELLAEEKLD